MMKEIVVSNVKDVDKHIAEVSKSSAKAVEQLEKLIRCSDDIKVFHKIKFCPVGCDPLNSERELNLVEQINQTFTYLVTFKAVKILFEEHPSLAPFRLNLGTAPGSDIESIDGTLAGEVFASVSPKNNQKLEKDIKKVSSTEATYKYVFFMSPKYENKENLGVKEGNVRVWALGYPMTF